MPAAQRAAHHISHLLREERAQQASYLRNVDCPDRGAERSAQPAHPVIFVLDNLRSAYNVGSIFRTADAAHCEVSSDDHAAPGQACSRSIPTHCTTEPRRASPRAIVSPGDHMRLHATSASPQAEQDRVWGGRERGDPPFR